MSLGYVAVTNAVFRCAVLASIDHWSLRLKENNVWWNFGRDQACIDEEIFKLRARKSDYNHCAACYSSDQVQGCHVIDQGDILAADDSESEEPAEHVSGQDDSRFSDRTEFVAPVRSTWDKRWTTIQKVGRRSMEMKFLIRLFCREISDNNSSATSTETRHSEEPTGLDGGKTALQEVKNCQECRSLSRRSLRDQK